MDKMKSKTRIHHQISNVNHAQTRQNKLSSSSRRSRRTMQLDKGEVVRGRALLVLPENMSCILHAPSSGSRPSKPIFVCRWDNCNELRKPVVFSLSILCSFSPARSRSCILQNNSTRGIRQHREKASSDHHVQAVSRRGKARCAQPSTCPWNPKVSERTRHFRTGWRDTLTLSVAPTLFTLHARRRSTPCQIFEEGM